MRAAGLDAVTFAWMGGRERGLPHNYRVQGPTFLIEYDCTQNGANHIHAVWRDLAVDLAHPARAEGGGDATVRTVFTCATSTRLTL